MRVLKHTGDGAATVGDVRQVEVIYLVEKEKCQFMGEWMSRATQELACTAESMEEVWDETVARWGGVEGEVIGKASVQDALQEMRAWRAARVETEQALDEEGGKPMVVGQNSVHVPSREMTDVCTAVGGLGGSTRGMSVAYVVEKEVLRGPVAGPEGREDGPFVGGGSASSSGLVMMGSPELEEEDPHLGGRESADGSSTGGTADEVEDAAHVLGIVLDGVQ
jgi:hypothetical protein